MLFRSPADLAGQLAVRAQAMAAAYRREKPARNSQHTPHAPHADRDRSASPPAPSCAVCMDAAPVVKLSGCNHVCLCPACAPRLRPKACPLCRKAFRSHAVLIIG